MNEEKQLSPAVDEWENETIKKTLERFPEREKKFLTISGIPMKRLYTPIDLADHEYQKQLGFPGKYPFTRGVQPTMYRGRFWTMRQYSG
ncbi:MAG: methylmalonyl-CoA mutase family protein, partial [Candidatus Thorarchaeota archaeon]|nr:methylmalonyl-CoA mutase family protein [Candidatus Thorarchaeota archaeon]